jgi:hypothetical protein
LYVFLSSTMRATCPAHLIRLDKVMSKKCLSHGRSLDV